MNLLKELINQRKNKLTENLEGWMVYHNAGDYEAWDNYNPESNEWSEEEELAVIHLLLTLMSKKLKHTTVTQDKLRDELKSEKPVSKGLRFFQILHLYTVLDLLNQQEDVDLEEEKDQLNLLGAEVLVISAVPGICLAYLGALKASSSMDNLSKLGAINRIIRNRSKMSKFGVLSDLVLREAVKAHEAAAEEAAKSDPDLLRRISDRMNEYKDAVTQCLTPEQIIKQLTFIDWCILRGLQRLKNGIGRIDLAGWDELFSKEERMIEFSCLLQVSNSQEDQDESQEMDSDEEAGLDAVSQQQEIPIALGAATSSAEPGVPSQQKDERELSASSILRSYPPGFFYPESSNSLDDVQNRLIDTLRAIISSPEIQRCIQALTPEGKKEVAEQLALMVQNKVEPIPPGV